MELVTCAAVGIRRAREHIKYVGECPACSGPDAFASTLYLFYYDINGSHSRCWPIVGAS